MKIIKKTLSRLALTQFIPKLKHRGFLAPETVKNSTIISYDNDDNEIKMDDNEFYKFVDVSDLKAEDISIYYENNEELINRLVSQFGKDNVSVIQGLLTHKLI
jgi:hypothetical protein